MSKKIIAIGGGNIGEKENGISFPYETAVFDKEIVRVSDAPKPNILFIGFAAPGYYKEYYKYFEYIFLSVYGCKCKNLLIEDLNNKHKINEYFDWADVIYVGGGNTFTLMKYFEKYEINERLFEAYIQGKVMSGISAGGMCWFSYGNTVNPAEKGKLIKQQCLGFQPLVFAPHCDEINGHFENVENLILNEGLVALSLSNCCAFELIDDKFKFLISEDNSSRYKIAPFAIRSYWDNGIYYTENINFSNECEDFNKLIIPNFVYNEEVRKDVKKLLKRRGIYFH